MKKHQKLRQEAIRLRRAGASLPEICRATGKARSTIHYWIANIDSGRPPMALSERFSDERFAAAVSEANSVTGVARSLGVSLGNHDSVKRRIDTLRLDTSHFKWPMRSAVRPRRAKKGRPGRPLEEILVRNSTYTCHDRLKIRLLAEGYFENRCCECGLPGLDVNAPLAEDSGGRVPIQLHHKNRVKNDHRIENLTLLCANCHHCEHGWNMRRVVHGMPLDGILVRNSTYVNCTRLRDKLLTAGYFEDRCSMCGLLEWRGQPMPIQLHHRNGVRSDCRLENLDILCSNCHGLTDHWCGRFAAGPIT